TRANSSSCLYVLSSAFDAGGVAGAAARGRALANEAMLDTVASVIAPPFRGRAPAIPRAAGQTIRIRTIRIRHESGTPAPGTAHPPHHPPDRALPGIGPPSPGLVPRRVPSAGPPGRGRPQHGG